MMYADVEVMVDRGKSTLGEAVWEVTFAAGWALLLEEAIAEALGDVQVAMSSKGGNNR